MNSEFQKLQESISKIKKEELYFNICKNVKKFRLEKCKEFKSKNSNNSINPYSKENIEALLDYNHTHYKRFESETDSTSKIPLDKLVKLSVILEKNLDEFLQES